MTPRMSDTIRWLIVLFLLTAYLTASAYGGARGQDVRPAGITPAAEPVRVEVWYFPIIWGYCPPDMSPCLDSTPTPAPTIATTPTVTPSIVSTAPTATPSIVPTAPTETPVIAGPA